MLAKLNNEMVAAMKAKDKTRKDAISSVISAVKKAAIDKKQKNNITDELVNEVLLKEVKTVQEMIDTCPENRADLKEQYQNRLNIVNEFAPKLVNNENDIMEIIEAIGLDIELVKNNRGTIMKELKSRNVDMKVANKVLSGVIK